MEVKVNVREVLAREVDESFEDEMGKVHRVDLSDTEQPANETARCRSSGRADSNVRVLRELDEIRDDEEVIDKVLLLDDRHLVAMRSS
jgi:hypothetical protein